MKITQPGYFWGYSVFRRSTIGANVMANPGANRVQVAQFVLPFDAVVTAVSLNVVVGKAGTHINIGLYDGNKNKVLDSGQISSAAAGDTGVTGLSFTVPAGSYYLAWSCDDATNAVTATVLAANNTEQNKNLARWGVAANSTSAGVMPATLGTITASTQSNAPAVFFEA